jgi:hypothetical protein
MDEDAARAEENARSMSTRFDTFTKDSPSFQCSTFRRAFHGRFVFFSHFSFGIVEHVESAIHNWKADNEEAE